MQYDFIELGSTPCSENCAQVGQSDYTRHARIECQVYKHQLERQFPVPDGTDCYYRVKSFSHDFGAYSEVIIYFNTSQDIATEFAFHVENNLPETWDPQAISELGN